MIYDEKRIEQLRKTYPAGTVICCDNMVDHCPIESGTVGVVEYVDDAGSIHTKWRNGRTLAVIPDVDEFHVVQPNKAQTMMESAKDKIGEYISAELQIHKKLVEIVQDIADCVLNGKQEFDIDELFAENDFRGLLLNAISEMLNKMHDIQNVSVLDMGIPFQNMITVSPSENREKISDNNGGDIQSDSSFDDIDNTEQSEDSGINMQ